MAIVTSVVNLGKAGPVCDLTVEDNHNLYVCSEISDSSVLVHNCLDENCKPLEKMGTPHYGLLQIFCSYDNDFYLTASFSKGKRATIKDVPLNKEVLNYGSMDCQSIIGIKKAQQAMSMCIDHIGKPYHDTYVRFMLVQMSNNIHMMSSLTKRGTEVDPAHLIHIASKKGPLWKLIAQVSLDLNEMESVRKANRLLIKKSKVPQQGLFGKVADKWVFDMSKQDHQQTLFFDVLKLEPVNLGKITEAYPNGMPSLDKTFQAEYKELPEVKALSRKNKISILRNTFAKAILRRMGEDPDSKIDGRIRPRYGYVDTVTGRANSSKPSLQQIPERSEEAKIIKRMFVAGPGKFKLKLDYSSHEVRGWGYISGDSNVAKTFQTIWDLLSNLRKKQNAKALKAFDEGGDLHKLNYSMFTGVPVNKITKEQRAQAKGIVFGSIYGMSARSLGESINVAKEIAQELMDKFFAKAAKAAKWLRQTAEYTSKNGYTFSPLGRRRNMFGAFTGYEKLVSAIGRRAQNSPIQGMSSDFVFDAARLIELAIYETFKKLGKIEDTDSQPSAGVELMVHDSISCEGKYEDFFIVMWIMEYCAIYGLRDMIEQIFQFKLNVDFAIEFEIGGMGSKMTKWDWTHDGLHAAIENMLKTQRDELGHDINVKKTMKLIYAEGHKHKAYLQKHFPLPVPLL